MDLSSQFLTINGIRLKVVIEGNGPDVILLHGFPDSSQVWRNQIPALASAGFRVIAPDLRGCGESDAPTGKKCYSVDAIISDIIELMRQLGIQKTRLVGHDWGANIGWIFTSCHPGLVDRYVALSVGHTLAYRRSGLRQVMRAWYAALFLVPGISEAAFRAFNWRFLRKISNDHPETEQWIENLSRPGRLTAGLRWYRDNTITMLTMKVPKIKVPCMGIWSDRDAFLTEKQMLDSEKYMDAPWLYERIENVGHWMQMDAPDLINQLLKRYLKLNL
ncbi:MAG: hypothetical protein CVV44_11195 [Spirochaetae bacterium HGW-Spirochaetae-1]|jgi:pimeloyl-ACP methyl ester carboxylesterase|nr:MAG: hypothetical protein CVV44_11195 [Spirochaetae bacterium HGW-Spirochaetae-1]